MANTQQKKKPTASAARKAPAKGTSRAGGTKGAAQKTPLRREIGAVVCLLLGLFSFIGFWGGSGVFIGFFAGLVKGLIGGGFYALAPMLLVAAAILCFHRGRPVRLRVASALLLPVLIGALVHLFGSKGGYTLSFSMFPALWRDGRALSAGGAAAGGLTELLHFLFGKAGTAIVLICLGLFMILVTLNKTIAGIYDRIKNRERPEYVYVPEPEPEPPRAAPAPPRVPRQRKKVIDIPMDDEPDPVPEASALPEAPDTALFNPTPRVPTPDQVLTRQIDSPGMEPSPAPPAEADVPLDIPFMERPLREPAESAPPAPAEPEKKKAEAEPFSVPEQAGAPQKYDFPPLDLLAAGAASGRIDGSEEVRLNSERLESAFRSFGVNVTIASATRGPTVTQYEAELEAGIKLSRLTSLADDIALSLGVGGVRIAAMPNKISTVGIEVPNKLVSKVYLREIIGSKAFSGAASKLTFAIGKNISGEAIVGNIAKLPHMLVAGTTGSGKSVCLNSLILSILYKATPEEVKFIMIDPKMVEFRVYNGIPHLLVPVVTDVKKAAGALQWAVVEMMKRYRLFSEVNARDLAGYNQTMDSSEGERLPQVVIVIDELADLMLQAAKEVEESVCRVAQMGRAAGVHLVIATQSPRADVITGLMKANIPSRIALKVSSALESRIILDAGGNADKLVGNGDMLYAPIGVTKPVRIQGTWVSDEERENVVAFIKRSGESQYSDEVISQIERAAEEKDKSSGKGGDPSAEDEPDYDELLPQGVEVFFETGQASVSMLQRRLKLGYSRAARIVDQMEQMGIVGPFEGSKPRQLMITKERWREMQYINGTAPEDTYMPEPETFEDYAEDEEI